MPANTFILGTGSSFRLRRPPAVSNGFVTDIDPRVQAQLDTLHGLLSAELFDKGAIGTTGTTAGTAGTTAGAAAPGVAASSGGQTTPDQMTAEEAAEVELATDLIEGLEPPEQAHRQRRTSRHAKQQAQAPPQTQAPSQNAGQNAGQPAGLDPATVLADPLTPQRALPASDKWAAGSLAAALDQQQQTLTKSGLIGSGTSTPANLISLSEYVDRVPDLSTLKYNVDDALASEWNTYSEPLRRVLDSDAYPALRVYLVAYAYLELQLRDVGAVKNFILSDALGARALIDYATIGAARELVNDKGFSISDLDVDDGTFVTKVRAAQIGMSTASFEQDVMSVVNELINNVDHKDLIDAAETTLGPLPLSTRMLLARYIDAAPVSITPQNVTYFASVWLAQSAPPPPATATEQTPPSDDDFNIETYQDDPAALQISHSAVLCAAQLYYTMVLGDELDVFSIVHYFTHRYLINGQMEVTDPNLRNDLQNYVFSNRFTDIKTGRQLDRSRPAERGMFYRQVFALGHGQVPEDLIVNDDFPVMWKTLMLQSATYLEKAQASLNPDGFVSRQQVMQAVEDLQYNLSTHCVGMATVATPLMYAELNFVIRNILMHPEVLKQVVPIGATWWRVVERLYMDLKQTRPRSTALYNKAKLGHDMIKSIADYNPATFEDDTNFSDFISLVDAYITTQSILQQALTDDLKRRQEDTAPTQPPGDGAAAPPSSPGVPAIPSAPPVPSMPAVPVGAAATNGGASSSGHGPSDEWDF